MRTCHLTSAGRIVCVDGSTYPLPEVDASAVRVPHLAPHVETFDLAEVGKIGILVRYSCHCWTREYDEALDSGVLRIIDRGRARVFDPVRYAASFDLPALMRALPRRRIYATRGDRNYGCYDADLVDANGLFYTAYFALKARKGWCDTTRYSFRLFVESAYAKAQQEPGRKTSLGAIVGASRAEGGADADAEE